MTPFQVLLIWLVGIALNLAIFYVCLLLVKAVLL